MVINWTLQLLSHNLVFVFHLILFGKFTSIPLLNMHLKSSVSSPEPAGFSHFLPFNYIQVPNPSFLEHCSRHVRLQNPISVFSTKSNPKPLVLLTILTSPNLPKLFPIVCSLEIFPSCTDTFTGIVLRRSGILFQFL